MEVLGQEKAYFCSGEFKVRYKPQVKKEIKLVINPTVAQNQPRIVYQSPVFNNCSFKTNPMSKVLYSAVFGRPRVLGSQQFKKRHIPEKVGGKKKEGQNCR